MIAFWAIRARRPPLVVAWPDVAIRSEGMVPSGANSD
jgi:hypothetical protein